MGNYNFFLEQTQTEGNFRFSQNIDDQASLSRINDEGAGDQWPTQCLLRPHQSITITITSSWRFLHSNSLHTINVF